MFVRKRKKLPISIYIDKECISSYFVLLSSLFRCNETDKSVNKYALLETTEKPLV